MIFSLVEGKKDAYAEMSIGHKIISAIADDGKAVVLYCYDGSYFRQRYYCCSGRCCIRNGWRGNC
nr:MULTISPECIES: hypothetical protein [Parabacteroides]